MEAGRSSSVAALPLAGEGTVYLLYAGSSYVEVLGAPGNVSVLAVFCDASWSVVGEEDAAGYPDP